MRIINSYKIIFNKHKKDIYQIIVDYNAANPVNSNNAPWSRTQDSFVFEWNLHNTAIIVPKFYENAKNCDFNNKHEGYTFMDFWEEYT